METMERKITKVTIKTRLHESVGGLYIEGRFCPTPRGLMTAVSRLVEVRAENLEGYGNIGCGRTWLEIDGQPIEDLDLMDMDEGAYTDRSYSAACRTLGRPATRTEAARRLLAQVAAGEYAEMVRAREASIDAYWAACERTAAV